MVPLYYYFWREKIILYSLSDCQCYFHSLLLLLFHIFVWNYIEIFHSVVLRKKKPLHSNQPLNDAHFRNRYPGRSRTTSFRQSGRNSQKSADSAIGMSESYTRSSYSDTECRCVLLSYIFLFFSTLQTAFIVPSYIISLLSVLIWNNSSSL